VSDATANVRVVRCNSWDEFVSAIRVSNFGTGGGDHERIFRGHGEAGWPLASVWDRFLLDQRRKTSTPVARSDSANILALKLQAFKDHATGLAAVRRGNMQSETEWMALGRHHGLVTELLDWTRSPYVAAFFAWTEYYALRNPGLARWGAAEMKWGDGAVAVWELSAPQTLVHGQEFNVFTSLTDDAHRQKAQQGVFTLLKDDACFDLETYLGSKGRLGHLTKYEISAQGRTFPTAIVDLTLMNIRYSTLFPDLEGAALQANLDAVLMLFGTVNGLMERGFRPVERGDGS
jgi:hypothetical protein